MVSGPNYILLMRMARVYEGLPGRVEQHKLCGSMRAWQKFVGPRAGKDRLCIAHNEMMSIFFPFLSPSLLTLYLHTVPTPPLP
jgi:hypothetical protein